MNAVIREIHEFHCNRCGELTATLYTGMTTCDDCAGVVRCYECSEVVDKAKAGDWMDVYMGEGHCPACQIADARGIF